MDVIDLVRLWDRISRKKYAKSVTLNLNKLTKRNVIEPVIPIFRITAGIVAYPSHGNLNLVTMTRE